MEAVQSLESAGLVLQPHPTVELGLSRLAEICLSLERWEERVAVCLPLGDSDSKQHLETQVLHVKMLPIFPQILYSWSLLMPGGSALRRSS